MQGLHLNRSWNNYSIENLRKVRVLFHRPRLTAERSAVGGPLNTGNIQAVKPSLRVAFMQMSRLKLRLSQKIVLRSRESIALLAVFLMFSLRWYFVQEILFGIALTASLTILVTFIIALTLILEQPVRRGFEWMSARLGRIVNVRRVDLGLRSKP